MLQLRALRETRQGLLEDPRPAPDKPSKEPLAPVPEPKPPDPDPQ